MDELSRVKEELEQLKQQYNSLAGLYGELCGALTGVAQLVEQINNEKRQDAVNQSILYNRLQNLPYEMLDPRYKDEKYAIPKVMTLDQTFTEVIDHKKSIARFGDGEFGIMFGVSRWRFQKNDERLARRLREVLLSDEDDVLIGLNDFYGDLSHRTQKDADGIRSYITPEIRAQHMELLRMDRLYANACISRNTSWDIVEKQKKIWDQRDCLFIEGDKTRMGVGNDLFQNALSIERILCPSESAFDKYDEILEEALKASKDKLVLIALGPTASVLAYDLAKAGYHAVDIGHADISYEWLLRNDGKKTEVPNKYNNEWSGGYIVEDIRDEVYESQIVCDLS